MAVKRHADGLSTNRATGGEGFAQVKATGEDDVEGHASRRRDADGEGIKQHKTTGGEGLRRAKTSGEDDDVEGHTFHLRSPSSRGE